MINHPALSLQQATVINLSYPADIELARIHAEANEVTILRGQKIDENAEVCECCRLPLKQRKFPLCTRLHLLGELGSSFPLYYDMARGVVISLSLCFSIACIACIIDNSMAGRYTEWTYDKSSNAITPANFGNIWLSEAARKSQGFGSALKIPIWQPILHVIVCVLLMIVYPFILKKVKEDSVDIDINYDTSADYTLFLKGLPSRYSKEELKNEIVNNFPELEIDIVNIVCTYDIAQCSKIAQDLSKWHMKLDFIRKYESKYNKRPVKKIFCKKKPYETVEECERQIKEREQILSDYLTSMSIDKQTPYAFVTFSSQVQAREIEEAWSPTAWRSIFNFFCWLQARGEFRFKGKYLRAEMAPDSCDINWENLAISGYKKFFQRFVTLVMMLITIVITFVIVYFTAKWKRQVYKEKESNSLQYLTAATIFTSLITITVNVLVSRLMRIFAQMEKHNTWSAYNVSVMDRIVVFMFVNTVLIHIVVYSDHNSDWFCEGGLIYSVFWLQVLNAGVSPLVHLINPKYQLRRIRRYFAVKAAKAGELQMTQREANELFMGPNVDLADRFASILKTCCLSLFFAPIVPIGPLIGIVAILIEVGIFNYMLLRVHCRPRKHNVSLVLRAVKWIPWAILVYSIGILGFFYFLTPEIVWLCWVNFALAIFSINIPFSYVTMKWFKADTIEHLRAIIATNKDNFFTHLKSFYSDFERDNPITSTTGWERWNLFNETNDPQAYRTLQRPDVVNKEFLMKSLSIASNFMVRNNSQRHMSIPIISRKNKVLPNIYENSYANEYENSPTAHDYKIPQDHNNLAGNIYDNQNPTPFSNVNPNPNFYTNEYQNPCPNALLIFKF